MFAGGLWSGYAIRAAQIGIFGAQPCWTTLEDVKKEADWLYKTKGWNTTNPDLNADCVIVDSISYYDEYRAMTRREIRDAE